MEHRRALETTKRPILVAVGAQLMSSCSRPASFLGQCICSGQAKDLLLQYIDKISGLIFCHRVNENQMHDVESMERWGIAKRGDLTFK